ncbi:glycerate kinase type-2 family protein [Rubripirellula reticaptiva]|nr:DUF4147 domain-containing protein [Rubripirellula reticaptiva]
MNPFNMNLARTHATEIWYAGLESVLAESLVRREVVVHGETLSVGGYSYRRSDFDRVIVVGAGKAGTAMATGLAAAIGDWLPVTGFVNVPEGTETEPGPIRLHPARPAMVNEPTQTGVWGTDEILSLVGSAKPRDLCIALISGGGSALMPAPIDGVTLAEKLEVTRFLSSSGANIAELNTVRKHLSRVKGGGLLRACRAGELVTLVLSDVLGDPLDLIASGATVPDTSTAQDAIKVLAKYDVSRSLPLAIYRTLAQDRATDSPTCHATTIVIGNNAVAVDEAGMRAEGLGYNHVMQVAKQCEGFAEDVGRHLAKMTVDMLNADPQDHRLDCLITGGEPVVKLVGEDVRGRGGRNQQLVLAAYQYLLGQSLTDEQWSRICILSGGTDGEDGPTDAAGAFIDADVHQQAMQLGLDVSDSLARNDAYTFFTCAGGLLVTGPTGTNVCDVRVALVTPV